MNVVADVEATFEVSLTTVTVSVPFELTSAKAVPPLANNPIPTNNVAPISFESVRPSLYFLNENFSFLLFLNMILLLHFFEFYKLSFIIYNLSPFNKNHALLINQS